MDNCLESPRRALSKLRQLDCRASQRRSQSPVRRSSRGRISRCMGDSPVLQTPRSRRHAGPGSQRVVRSRSRPAEPRSRRDQRSRSRQAGPGSHRDTRSRSHHNEPRSQRNKLPDVPSCSEHKERSQDNSSNKDSSESIARTYSLDSNIIHYMILRKLFKF